MAPRADISNSAGLRSPTTHTATSTRDRPSRRPSPARLGGGGGRMTHTLAYRLSRLRQRTPAHTIRRFHSHSIAGDAPGRHAQGAKVPDTLQHAAPSHPTPRTSGSVTRKRTPSSVDAPQSQKRSHVRFASPTDNRDEQRPPRPTVPFEQPAQNWKLVTPRADKSNSAGLRSPTTNTATLTKDRPSRRPSPARLGGSHRNGMHQHHPDQTPGHYHSGGENAVPPPPPGP